MAYPPPAFSYATPKYPHNAIRDVPLFQPSKSPASTYADRSVAMGADYFSRGSRKRQRSDSLSYDYLQTRIPNSRTSSWAQLPTPSDDGFSFSSSRQVNDRYRLAGGYDTPSVLETSQHERSFPVENANRRRLRDEDFDNGQHSESSLLTGPLARERNGVARMPSDTREGSPSTWTGLAFNFVGKVFSFGTSVVKGFYAGGGKGYDMNEYGLVGSDLLQASAQRQRQPLPSPLPGAWEDGEFLGDFEQDNPTFTPSPSMRPANKRRQTDKDTWVVVPQQELAASTSHPVSLPITNAADMNEFDASKPTASRAQNRKSIAAVPPRRQSGIVHNGSPLTIVPPSAAHRRASVASMRSAHSRHNSGNGSPLSCVSPEAERFARRQAKQERATDKAMNSMSRRMEEMIRQAQEALGTKFSVEGADDSLEDEGFVDDDGEEW